MNGCVIQTPATRLYPSTLESCEFDSHSCRGVLDTRCDDGQRLYRGLWFPLAIQDCMLVLKAITHDHPLRIFWVFKLLSRNESGRFGALKSDSTHHFFRNACIKSGSLRFSVFRLLTDFVCLYNYEF
jgi:hypothetical protein